MSAKNSGSGPIERTTNDVKRTAKKAAYSPYMEALVRLGYGVRGVIYITMGLLAVAVALGRRGAPADQQGAINALGKQPGGGTLLWVILIGLISYALWGVIRAVFDPLHKGSDTKGLLARGGYLVSAISYAILASPTYRYVTNTGGGAQTGAKTQSMLASILSKSWGPVLIGLFGLVVLGVGLYQIYQGFSATFDKQFSTYAMTAEQRRLAIQLGRFGTAARGVIVAVLGWLLLQAAFHANPKQPVGVDAALATLLHQPYGIWILGLVALGLVAFGIFSLFSAVWFRLGK